MSSWENAPTSRPAILLSAEKNVCLFHRNELITIRSFQSVTRKTMQCTARSAASRTKRVIRAYTECIFSNNGSTFVFILPYINQKVQIGVIFTALGLNDDTITENVTLPAKYVGRIVHSTAKTQMGSHRQNGHQ